MSSQAFLRSVAGSPGRVPRRLAGSLVFAAVAGLFPLSAQAQSGTGTLLVRVAARGDTVPLAGAFVRSGRNGGVTDSTGWARLELPGGLTRVLVTSAGFLPWAFEITIVPDAPQRVSAALDPTATAADGVPIQATRSAGRVRNEPTAVTVVDAPALVRLAQRHPAGIERLLDGLPAVRSVGGGGPLGATSLRVRGLPSRHLGLLRDGMPVYGASPSAFAPGQLASFDTEQAELITGPAAGLFGPSGAGSVLNLVSRRPDRDTARLAINQSSEKGGDAMLWGSHRFSPTAGASLLAEFHQQRLVDADDDQWSEFPRAIRFRFRPQLFLDSPSGDALAATAGFMTEDRTGGFLLSTVDDDPYRQQLRTRQFETSVRMRRLAGHNGRIELKVSAFHQTTNHRLDDARFRDRRSTLFAEFVYANVVGRGRFVAGLAVQRDGFRHLDLEGFDYTHTAPSIFGQLQYPIGERATVSVNLRCDHHNVYGTFCSPRGSLVTRPSEEFTARITAAAGYSAPTPLAAGAELIGLQAFFPTATNAERLQHGGLDLAWRRNGWQITGSLSFTRVTRAVHIVPIPDDSTGRLRLINATEPTRVLAADLEARYDLDPVVFRGWYSHTQTSEQDPTRPGRRETALSPKHRFGGAVAFEGPATGTFAEIRAAYVGAQSVWDNPFRVRTPGFTIIDGLASQRMGRARLYLSVDNLFDTKLRTYELVVLPVPGLGGQRNATPWAPARGRVISLGAIVEW